MKEKVYLALGSNLQEPLHQLREAIVKIKSLDDVSFVAVSSIYLTKPMGPKEQPDFYNVVLELETVLSAKALHAVLSEIEASQGRVREEDSVWGQARTIDIDILLYGDEEIISDSLTIPHVGLVNRDFFIVPLVEIAPNVTLPNGLSVKDIKLEEKYIKERIPWME